MKKWNLIVVLKFGTLIVAAVLLLMHIFKLWNGALGIFEPMMGVVVMLQGVQFWKENRPLSVLSFCAGVFVIGVSVYMTYF